MLDLINRYCHGFVALPVIHSLKQNGLLTDFDHVQSIDFDSLVSGHQTNPGYLKTALRLLESLEILEFNQAYEPGKNYAWLNMIPADLDSLLQLDLAINLDAVDSPRSINYWVQLSLRHWSIDDPVLIDFLDGLIILPLLLYHREEKGGETDFKKRFDFIGNQELLEKFFITKGWAALHRLNFIELTSAGKHLLKRIFIAGTVYSYRPMFLAMNELIFGDCSRVFSRDEDGHELHLDRLMNVQASGFQHERFFKDCQVIIADIFNQLPIENQPDYIADMGCGDGSLLKSIYQLIKTDTKRGEVLDKYPLLMIGADYNQKALAATSRTLGDIPHKTIQADIGDPESFLQSLFNAGVQSADKVLHVRSFLDHDRPYIAPKNLTQLEQRPPARQHAVYADRQGQLIPAKDAYQSLVEHLSRWSSILGHSGALFLEVHSLAPRLVARYLDQSENLHFDAYHAFSGQMLVDADEFLLAAAESGLFPRLDFACNYPKTFPFCRITLNWFEKKDFCLRPALAQDLPALLALDKACWDKGLCAGEEIIKARMTVHPQGQFVVEQQGMVVGAVYSQRIQSETDLDTIDFYSLPELHTPNGTIVQILGMNIKPELQHLALGDQILDFLLYVFALTGDTEKVVGISRCKQFVDYPELTMEQYIQQCRDSGQWDTVLNFHAHHGAEVVKPIKDYWDKDIDNHGYGVLIRYNFTDKAQEPDSVLDSAQIDESSVRHKIIDEAVFTILGPRRQHLFAADRALMESGLDSLDLLELRNLLSKRLGMQLEPMFFFSYPTVNAIKAFFDQDQPGPQDNIEQTVIPDIKHISVPGFKAKVDNKSSDIAIIGMACRFPGGVDSPESLWQILTSGTDTIEPIPPERWDSGLYDHERVCRYGGFIKQVDRFDAEFFNLSPREARLMDPQHRLLMETAWETFENAAINPQQAKKTGVFIGIYSHDYELLTAERLHNKNFDVYHAIGNSASMAAGRLSYFFGFQGPAVSVDTACSSSLLAVQQACDSLRKGESRLALAGGVNLILTPDLHIVFSKSGMLADDGHCKTFSADADGYVRSEGCGLVLLKPLADAINDNDQVLAVIKGSATNQDGASNGITAPNGMAQRALMQQALQAANVKASDISLLEAHGTGTPLGDPVEFESIAEIYSQERDKDKPLVISSVKTNIGHTESAAGIAGLIKLVLAFKHEFIPPHLHLKQLNPRILLAAIPAQIPTQGLAWPEQKDNPRLAAISSFGFSGTNAHMIVADAGQAPQQAVPDLPCVLPVSAQTPDALIELAQRYQQLLSQGKPEKLLNIAATAAIGRQHFSQRLAFSALDSQQLAEKLTDFVQAGSQPEFVENNRPKITFLFTGQGSQYLNMSRELYYSRSYFRDIFDQCSNLFAGYIKLSLSELLFSGRYSEQDLQQTRVTQPALFCLEYALAKQWQQWGIEPDILIGHSIGEYAAACLAGVFNINDAVKLVAKRGQLMQGLQANGKMAAVNCSQQQLEGILSITDERVIACFNAPERLVISGTSEAIDAAMAQLVQAQVPVTELQVSHAFHSPLMHAMVADFKQTLQQVNFNKPTINIISTLTGHTVTEEMTCVDYWSDQIIRPVNFTGAINSLCDTTSTHHIFLEIGPRSVLTGLARQIANNSQAIKFLSALDAGVNDNLRIAENIGHLYESGLNINWQQFYGLLPFNKVLLPNYPFQRQRYWLDQVYAQIPQYSITDSNAHPLLGHKIPSPLADQYQTRISDTQPEWLAGHVIDHQVIFPLAGYIATALAASGQDSELAELLVEKTCCVTDKPLLLQTIVQQQTISIYSLKDELWQRHFSCQFKPLQQLEGALNVDILKSRLTVFPVDRFYQDKAERGYQFSRPFCALTALFKNPDQALAYAEYAEQEPHYQIHPVLLDAAFQCALALVDNSNYLPFSVQRIAVFGSIEQGLWSHAKVKTRHQGSLLVDIELYDSNQQLVACVEGLLFKQASKTVAAQPSIDNLLYQVDWLPKSLPLKTGELISRLQQDFDQSAAFESIKGSADQLNQLAVAYICQGLLGLGCRLGDHFDSAGSVLEKLAIDSRYLRLIDRVLQILSQRGLVQKNVSGWTIGNIDQLGSAALLYQQLLTDFPALSPEAKLINRCGENLKAILRGEAEPLGFIFPADKADETVHFYRSSLSFVGLNNLLAQAVESLVHSHGRPCRILEIGAGTGSATHYILPRLSGKNCRYSFTDVSGYFTGQAKQAFNDYDFVDYACLDIEKEPTSQGFNTHSYDIIIASNVLHATADLISTVQHCQQLLTDDGRLILLEGIEATPWIDCIFGLTDGWWRFNDTVRQDYPLLSGIQWHSMLNDIGLNADCLALEHEDAPFKQAIIVAGKNLASNTGTWLIFDEQQDCGESIQRSLASSGIECIRVVPGTEYKQFETDKFQINPDRAEDYLQLIENISGAGKLSHVVNCWPLSPKRQTNLTGHQVLQRAEFVSCTGLYITQALVNAGLENITLCHVSQYLNSIHSTDECQQPEAAVLNGLNKVAALEHRQLKVITADLDTDKASLDYLIQALQSAQQESQLAFRNGQQFVARLNSRQTELDDAVNRHWQLGDNNAGSVDALQLIQQPRSVPAKGQVEIRVQQAGLNFIDVMETLGLLPFKRNGFGMECVGTVSRCGEAVSQFTPGQRVLALAEGAFADYVNVDAFLVAELPQSISALQAATLPVNFLTAGYALDQVAKIKPGDKVLIHAASGGTGMAAVQVALQAGAEVYATASREKWSQVKALGVKAVMNSRDLSFVDDIKQLVGDNGLDIVFNSLTGEFIPAGLSLLKAGGQFIEIGKREILTPEQLANSAQGVSYHVIDLRQVAQSQPEVIQPLLQTIVESVEQGRYQALPQTCFDWSQLPDACRFMQQARHTGKIVLQNRANYTDFSCDPDACYLITGGFKGVGFFTAQWLAEKGAKHVILLGRSAMDKAHQEKLTTLQAQEVEVDCMIADVTDDAAMSRVFDQIKQRGRALKGIVHSVGVLDDGAILQQNRSRFTKVLAPKIAGAWNLHHYSRNEELDFFVMFSSVAGLLGSAGQSNHAAANAYLDALAFYRRSQGLPGQSINWCGWSRIGSAAEKGLSNKIRKGLSDITPEQGAQILTSALTRDDVQIGVTPIDWPQFLADAPMTEFYEFYQPSKTVTPTVQKETKTQLDIQHLLQSSLPERTRTVKHFIASELAVVLGMEQDQLNKLRQRHAGFFDLGLDSLTSVEFKNRLSQGLGISVSTPVIFDYPNVDALSEHLMTLLQPEQAIVIESEPENSDDIDNLTVEQAAALLAKELE